MTATTVNVTVNVNNPDGSSVVGAVITAKLTGEEVSSQGYIIPREVTGTTDATGTAILALWPNALGSTESMYDIKIVHPTTGKTVKVQATIPNANCNLKDVANLPAFEGKTDGQLAIDAAVAAVVPAQAAQAAAEAARNAAQGFRDTASTHATNAGTSASQAAASKAAVDASASAAAGSASLANTRASDALSAKNAAEAARDLAQGYRDTASGHAATATTKAGEALASKNAAETAAGTATTKAAESASSAQGAAGSATTAQNAANTATTARDVTTTARDVTIAARDVTTAARDVATGAATSAGAAATQALAHKNAAEAAKNATDTNAAAVLADKNAADVSAQAAGNASAQAIAAKDAAVIAKDQAVAATVNVSAATTASTTAQAEAIKAASAAVTAQQMRDAAIVASQTALAGNEVLAAISKSIHSGAVVDAFLYDTSKDSDGGAWRKRKTDASWFNETIYGTWLGQFVDERAARQDDNLLLAPENWFLNPPWGNANMGATPNAALDSSGNMTMNKLLDTTATSNHYREQLYASLNDNALVSVSVLLKAAERSFVGVGFIGKNGGLSVAKVDLATGIITSLTQGTGNTNVTASIAAEANGCYRVTLNNINVSSGATTPRFRVIFYDLATGTATTYTGDGATGVYAGQAKLYRVGATASTYSGSPELVSNGTFDSGTTGWTPFNSSTTLAAVNGQLEVTYTGNTTLGRAEAAIPTVAGKAYMLTLTVASKTGSANPGFRIGTTSGQQEIRSDFIPSVGVPTTIAFLAQGTTTYLDLTTGAGALTGDKAYFDNVSVKEVTSSMTPYVPYSAMNNAYYQNTTDGKFYSFVSGTGLTEVFRGNMREFPEQVAIIAESTRITIYDLTQPGVPMWKVEMSRQTGGTFGDEFWRTSKPISGLTALNGVLFFALTGTTDASCGLAYISYVSDVAGRYSSVATSGGKVSYPVRHTASLDDSLPVLVSPDAKDVAATVLPDAILDPATKLPVPTISVGTAGGLSIIHNNGTVVNSASTTSVVSVKFDDVGYGLATVRSDGTAAIFNDVSKLAASFTPSATYTSSSIPAVLGTATITT